MLGVQLDLPPEDRSAMVSLPIYREYLRRQQPERPKPDHVPTDHYLTPVQLARLEQIARALCLGQDERGLYPSGYHWLGSTGARNLRPTWSQYRGDDPSEAVWLVWCYALGSPGIGEEKHVVIPRAAEHSTAFQTHRACEAMVTVRGCKKLLPYVLAWVLTGDANSYSPRGRRPRDA